MLSNPLDELKISRNHIIAVHEAYTHTNKKTSSKRAKNLLELLEILKYFDMQRNKLIWEEEKQT